MKIRPAREKDAAVVAALSAELGYPAPIRSIRKWIRIIRRSHSDLLLVACNHTEAPIGWIQAHAANYLESGLRVHLVGLVVSANARRGGVGHLLVRAAEEWAVKRGADVIIVRSNVSRHESHLFYPALGYKLIKTQRVYGKALSSSRTNEKK